ncbi:MAG TPA: DUF4157 domain-containing protein [Tepidiformaceae bacterium]|nr:DUF4157 domain-containing protein [Tepidiformaceae bacterium]
MADYQLPQYDSVRKPQTAEARSLEKVSPPSQHPLISLQARAGNQAVARMVQRHGAGEESLQMKHDASIQREEGAEAEEEELQMKHDPSIQREEEAEAEEEELQMKHDPSIQREEEAEAEEEELQMKHDPSIQREEEAEAEEEELQMKHDPSIQREEGAEAEEEELQMKHDPAPRVGLEGGPVGPSIENQINGMRGAGSSVPDGIRTQMERATGADLSDVRVHQDKDSDTLNRQLTAKAFTTGKDIFLRSDASTGDSHLMGHELAHVVQQSSGRTSAGGNGMAAGAANDPLEHEADQLAEAVLSGNAQRHAEEMVP